ncbi:MAG: ABC transporter ATP-binding protein [Bacteroidales bacterium]|nr:ABC transporter ATP-binding protein [Bacteroidales bacterium]
MIKADYITKSFGSVQVLKGVSLEVAPAEVLCITGASGAGKTTFLQIIGTLLRPDMGQVWIADTPVMELKKDRLADFRNKHIGFVFQFHHLLPEFTALENVCIPGLIAKDPADKVRTRAKELLDFLGMGHRMEHKPSELSGGEQQRVAVARALVNRPKVLLADEPSGNLDTRNKEELHRLFFQLRDTYRQTIVLVSHDPSLATLSDRSLIMSDGLIL